MTLNQIRAVMKRPTLLNPEKLKVIFNEAKRVDAECDKDAAFIEVGIYKGGCVEMLSLITQRQVIGVDTFEGLPEKGKLDWHNKGEFLSSYDEITQAFKEYKNVSIHKGYFPKSIDRAIKPKWFSLVHLDVDQHESTFSCLQYLWPALVSGGSFIVDDYGWKNCPGVKAAVDDFVSLELNCVKKQYTENQIVLRHEVPLTNN